MLRRKIAHDKRLAQLSCDRARLFFTWCIPFVDVDGRMTGDADVIKAMVFPFVKTISLRTLEQDIAECDLIKLVRAYDVDGQRYLYFPGFHKNQQLRRDREAKSEIPPPPDTQVGDADEGPRGSAPGVGDPVGGSTPGGLPDNSGSTPAEVKLSEEKRSEVKGAGAPRDGTSPKHSDLQVDFARFWRAYPRKVKREHALKAWRVLKPSPELTDAILAAIEQHKHTDDWVKDGGKYIPHPTTWLNGRRWEDDLGAPANGNAASDDQASRNGSRPAVLQQLQNQEAEIRKAGAGGRE